MLTITINRLEVGSINNIGSVNVGKTILCRNSAFNSEISGPPQTPDMAELPLPGFPTVGQIGTQAELGQSGHVEPPTPPAPQSVAPAPVTPPLESTTPPASPAGDGRYA